MKVSTTNRQIIILSPVPPSSCLTFTYYYYTIPQPTTHIPLFLTHVLYNRIPPFSVFFPFDSLQKERNGSSRQAIKKYIHTNYKGLGDNADSLINQALKKGVEGGDFLQPKGASGPVKLVKKEAKKDAAAKPKKAVAKKDAATKKTTAKKPAPTAAKASAAKPKVCFH
jgi:hypothetical protein